MATFLVTGAAGFIGSHLVEYLLKNNHQVVGLDNLSSGSNDNLTFVKKLDHASHFKLVQGDIRSKDLCEDLVKNVDFVLHQAALSSVPKSFENPLEVNDININGTLNLLQAAKKHPVKRFVLASSCSVYGDTPHLPIPETAHFFPMSPYAISKATAEFYTRLYYEDFGVPTVNLRYFNVFGPRQKLDSDYSAVIPKFIKAILNNEKVTIYGNGQQTRDFVYVKNIVLANVFACFASQDYLGKSINIGTGHSISILDLVESILKLTEKETTLQFLPRRTGDIEKSVADIKALKGLNIKMDEWVSFEDGLAQLIESLK